MKESALVTVRFSPVELEALAGASETMVDAIGQGKYWQNESPETVAALKRAAEKVMAQCRRIWDPAGVEGAP